MFTVLEKYHQVPDSLDDLRSQFHFKEATSKNVEHLQQAINLQQTYSTTLCGHIIEIFSRLTKLETEIQNLAEKFKTEQEDVQIDALDFDPDIDKPDIQWAHCTTVVVSVHELLTSADSESVDASNPAEETAGRDQLDTRHPTAEDTHWSHNLPQQVSEHPLVGTPTEPQQARTTEHNAFEEIPHLEEKEDWENG